MAITDISVTEAALAKDSSMTETATDFFKRRAGKATGQGLLAYLENGPDSPFETEGTQASGK